MRRVSVVLFLLISFGIASCSQDAPVSGFKAEAIAVCNVFKPESWEGMPKDAQPVDIQRKLREKLTAAIVSTEMQEIINRIPSIELNERYSFYAESVSRLLGESHDCPEIKDYLMVS